MSEPIHIAGTEGGPQRQWGTCTCGWRSFNVQEGADARPMAYAEAAAHVAIAHLVDDLAESMRGLGR